MNNFTSSVNPTSFVMKSYCSMVWNTHQLVLNTPPWYEIGGMVWIEMVVWNTEHGMKWHPSYNVSYHGMKHRDHGMKRSWGTHSYPRMKHRQHSMNFFFRYQPIPRTETDDHGYETDTYRYETMTMVWNGGKQEWKKLQEVLYIQNGMKWVFSQIPGIILYLSYSPAAAGCEEKDPVVQSADLSGMPMIRNLLYLYTCSLLPLH